MLTRVCHLRVPQARPEVEQLFSGAMANADTIGASVLTHHVVTC